MADKKVSADWNIAATHWLTAGFVIPLVLGLIAGVPLAILLGKDNIILFTIAISIVSFVSTYLGVIYSSKYLNKTYIIKDANQIVILSTLYLVITRGGFMVYQFMKTGVSPYESIGFIISVIIFYLASKKYIKNN